MSPRFKYKTKFERQKYNTMIVYLKTNNLNLCLNRELKKILDYKFMLKLQCKTTFNSGFVDKKIIKIEQESTLE